MNTSLLQKALDVVESLTLEDQRVLFNILDNRLKQNQRQEIIQDIKEVRLEYEQGKVQFGTVDEFLEELDN